MNVLVLGAEGFIGRRLASDLAARGHRVLHGVRATRRARSRVPALEVEVDFGRDVDAADWRSRLQCGSHTVAVVVNAVGLFKESRLARFVDVHDRAPAAIAVACAEIGCRFVHVSALGADATSRSAYQASKGRGEAAVRAALPSAAIVRPGLVYGADGASARLFTTIASLPLIVLPWTGAARLQPIHLDDLAAALVALVETQDGAGVHPLVGPRALTWRAWFACLRAGLGAGPARVLELPRAFDALIRLGGVLLGGGLVDRETLAMLRAGNCASVTTTRALLGRSPRDPADFVPPATRAQWRRRAELGWLVPVARLALAVTWAWSAIVSAGLYPREQSFALLAATGLSGRSAAIALAAGVLVDAACAVLSLWVPHAAWRPWVWRLQIIVIAVYTVIVTSALPGFWLHPFGPLLKNLPLLALLWLLARLDRQDSTARGS